MASSEASETIEDFHAVDPYEFESFVADLWEQQGWSTYVSPGSNDRGIDVVASRDEPVAQKHLIQVKRYAPENKVGGPEIQQYASLLHQDPDADAVIVVTTSGFTRQARELAADLNVKLIDGAGLQRLVEKYAPENDESLADVPMAATTESNGSSDDLSYFDWMMVIGALLWKGLQFAVTYWREIVYAALVLYVGYEIFMVLLPFYLG